ncbi:MAG: sensor histidine kinase [Clostridia bacterium]|nr:sensor histidine kinase [Clostridia bacterium]
MKRKSLGMHRRILMTCIAISIFSALAISLVSYNLIIGVIRDKESADTQNKLEGLSLALEQRVHNVLSFMDSFVSNNVINSALHRPSLTYSNKDADLISTLFKTAILSTDNIIDSIIVYTDRGKFYAGGNGISLDRNEVRRRMLDYESRQPVSPWYLALERKPTRETRPDYILALYYPLQDTSRLRQIGFVYVVISPERLMDSLQASSSGRRILVVDADMQVIYSSDGQAPGQMLDEALAEGISGESSFLYDDGENGRQFGVHTTTGETGWHMVSLIPYAAMTREVNRYILYIAAMFAAAMAFVILFSVSSTRHIVKPLHQLMDSMVGVQNGNYDVELPAESSDEVGQLTRTYRVMLNRIKQLIADIYASEKKKRETELLVLQTQINPHFLYNTLNSIHWIAMVHGLNSISDMVNSLVAILRYSLNNFSTFTTLKVEVDMLEPYLFIQNVRFGNGISFSSHVPAEFERCQIPRLLLQPLVENAISHGLRPKGGKGHIHIECAAIDGVLCVDVIDNGVGLPEDVPEFTDYETLRAKFPASGDQTSIGLENTFTRIRLYFGERYGLLFKSQAEQGATVRVTLPIAEAKEEDP